jgi:hypothetical protein
VKVLSPPILYNKPIIQPSRHPVLMIMSTPTIQYKPLMRMWVRWICRA